MHSLAFQSPFTPRTAEKYLRFTHLEAGEAAGLAAVAGATEHLRWRCILLHFSHHLRPKQPRNISGSPTLRQARPPAWLTLLAPLKTVLATRTQASCTGLPSANLSALGMTVQPRRVPVKPAYLEKEHVSSAHVSAPVCWHRERD